MSESAQEMKGRTKQAAGDLADDDKLKREGQVDQTAAKAKDKVDRAAERAKDAMDQLAGKAQDRIQSDR
jgi:uncharacterized protein YjbJ (UPF0337 family)